ncbi:hypothetical protein Dimus_025024 [Dionaea muscipula]
MHLVQWSGLQGPNEVSWDAALCIPPAEAAWSFLDFNAMSLSYDTYCGSGRLFYVFFDYLYFISTTGEATQSSILFTVRLLSFCGGLGLSKRWQVGKWST